MDETAVDLTESITSIRARKGVKHVSVKLPNNLPFRVTVLLIVSYSGEFLPPMIVFKAKPRGSVEKEFTRTYSSIDN